MPSARAVKEIRTLLPTWLLVTVAGTLPQLASSGPFFRLWEFVSVVGFYVGIPLLAVFPMAYEFQYRTLPLLLSQPIARRRILLEKILLVVTLVLTAGLAYAWGWHDLLEGDWESQD